MVRRFHVAGGEQVEQQAPGDGDAQPQVRAGLRLGDPAGHRGGDDWFKPVDDPVEELVEEPGGMRVALQGLTVKLEEQALVRPQRGGGEVLLPRAHELAAPLVRAVLRRGNQRALERLVEQLRARKVGDASG